MRRINYKLLEIKQWFLDFIYTKLIFLQRKILIILINGLIALNKLNLVLVEKKRIGKWLNGKNKVIMSCWCTNELQPSFETLFTIA